MPTEDDEEKYKRAQYQLIADFSRELGTVVRQVEEKTAQLLSAFRDDTNRAITGIYTRLIEQEVRDEKEHEERGVRQGVLDTRLDNQDRALRRLSVGLWIGVIICAVLILAIGAFLIGRWWN